MASTPGAPTPGPATAGSERLRRIPLYQRILARPAAGSAIILVFVWIVFAILGGSGGFLTVQGTVSYLDVAAQIGILGTAVALLMIAGEFDLSVGSLVGFAGIVIGIGVTEMGLPVWAAIAMSMVLTTMLGIGNGIIVVKTGLPSFIVTLATLFIIKGMTIVAAASITNVTYVAISKDLIQADPIAWVFNASIDLPIGGNIKVSILWWLVIAAIGIYVYSRTSFGNWIAGVGGSPVAARNLGVPVSRVKITLFAGTALSAAILAAVQSMTFFSADVLRGTGMELRAITTAVIGGTLLVGGYGSVAGTAIGALALGMAQIGIFFAGINADWYNVALGSMLLIAVVLNNWIRRRFAGLR
ncbi:MAG: ABC transporter permease [Chloroflexi bacterium]|nr:ABC transporter permease [Chloroflexota bacterium]